MFVLFLTQNKRAVNQIHDLKPELSAHILYLPLISIHTNIQRFTTATFRPLTATLRLLNQITDSFKCWLKFLIISNTKKKESFFLLS